MENLIPPKQWLQEEFKKRRKKNALYSLRAFAKMLGISSGRLSEILAGKRNVSEKMALKLALNLGLTPSERKDFFTAAKLQKKDSAKSILFEGSEQEAKFHAINADTFQLIAEWQHYAILSLMKTQDFSADPKWIAKRLGISSIEATASLDLMERLQMLVRKDGQLERRSAQLTTTQDISSVAIRKSHVQNLEQAIRSLEEVPVELRDISSITMAISPARLPEAKEKIKKFRRAMSHFLEEGDAAEVYNLNIQLVPVTKVRKGSTP